MLNHKKSCFGSTNQSTFYLSLSRAQTKSLSPSLSYDLFPKTTRYSSYILDAKRSIQQVIDLIQEKSYAYNSCMTTVGTTNSLLSQNIRQQSKGIIKRKQSSLLQKYRDIPLSTLMEHSQLYSNHPSRVQQGNRHLNKNISGLSNQIEHSRFFNQEIKKNKELQDIKQELTQENIKLTNDNQFNRKLFDQNRILRNRMKSLQFYTKSCQNTIFRQLDSLRCQNQMLRIDTQRLISKY